MDGMLEGALRTPPPELGPDFDRQLARTLRRPRLTAVGRLILTASAIVAASLSLWSLRSAGASWPVAAAALLVPAFIVAGALRRHILPGR